VLLVTTLAVEAAREGPGPGWEALLVVALAELVGGAVMGLGVGWLGGRFLARFAPGSSALFAIGVVAVGVLAYGVADLVHTSGFLACYLAALVLGNMGLPHRAALVGLSSALGWLAQIGLFVLLGLLADPVGLLDDLGPALVVGLVLLLVARPVSVLVSCLPFRIDWRTQAFLSWAGLRGAVPVVLATVPLTAGTPGVTWIFDLVFVLVVVFTLVQGPTLPWVARRLRLDEAAPPVDLVVETTPLEELGADLMEVTVGPGSRLAGVRVFELRLPRGVVVTLVVRDGTSLVPREQTRIERGDRLLVVAPSRHRPATERRLEAVSREGRLAGWAPGPEDGAGGRAGPAGSQWAARVHLRHPRAVVDRWRRR
jgi:cell volume regulation protein A